jgi:hypothetical protein
VQRGNRVLEHCGFGVAKLAAFSDLPRGHPRVASVFLSKSRHLP